MSQEWSHTLDNPALGMEMGGFKFNFHYMMVLRLAWVTKDADSKKKK